MNFCFEELEKKDLEIVQREKKQLEVESGSKEIRFVVKEKSLD